MNTKLTPPHQSRQASMTPHPMKSNGYLSHDTSVTLINPCKKSESMDTFEMQIYETQRRTLEAFDELEHLVSNGNNARASIVRMSSLIQE